MFCRKPCDLVSVGEPFGKFSYGFALPAGHPLDEALHQGVAELHETGDIEQMEEKWWTGKLGLQSDSYSGINHLLKL